MNKISRYAHVFRLGNHNILYHAITTKVFFITEMQADFILNDKNISEAFSQNEIEKLKSKGIVINTDEGIDEISVHDIIKRNRHDKPDVFALYLILTENCNMNCRYCSEEAHRTRKKQENMDLKTIVQTLEKFYATNTTRKRSVTLYGGEPLINKKGVICAVDYIRNEKNDFDTEIVIFTNATLLDDEIITYFSDKNVDVIVSIDGDKDIHDKYRLIGEQGTFDLVNNAISKMIAKKFRFSISATMTVQNVANLDKVTQYFIREFNPVHLILGTLHTPPEDKKDMGASPKEMAEGLLSAYEVARDCGLYIESVMNRVRPFVLSTPRFKDCPSCGGMIRVLPNGSFGPCSHLMEEGKNIESELLTFGESEIVKSWNNRLSCNLQGCESCDAIALCGGGCPYNSLKNKGDLLISTNDKRTCIQAKLTLKWLLSKLCDDFPENTFVEVTKYEKQKLLGNIDLSKHVPLSGYWKYGEFILEAKYE